MPLKELERLEAVHRYLSLELSVSDELQKIVKTAAEICGTPTALISLIDEDTQYIKFKQAFDFTQTEREHAFCNHTIGKPDFFVVEDALKDHNFVNNPLVTGNPMIRFYAGIPLTTHDGYNLGSLCVIDQIPREISAMNLKMLKLLARHAINLFEFESGLALMKQQYLEAKQVELKLSSFFESSTSEHIIIDRDYTILAFNKRLRDFVNNEYGIAIEKGMKVTNFIRENYLLDFVKNCQRALDGEQVRHERLIQFGPNAHWCDITYDPARNSSGEIIGVSFNSTDITDRIVQQQKMMNHQDILMETAFLQSHELRKPVANIKGLLTLLEMDGYFKSYSGLFKIQKANDILDERIHAIVGFTGT
ncbi:MAG: GAF domain-containing protein [Pedobacter sp.]|uniref:GAF domain-containing protein n=1 Tax=Pedobacter sp. TaxID=1411316 RepID=UPI003392EC25